MKLKLNVEEMRVETFDPADDGLRRERGTVRGHGESEGGTCASADPTCPLACDPGATGTCQPGWTEVWTSPCCD